MSAERLREAAALLRHRAKAATPDICPDWIRGAVRHIARNCEIDCYHEPDDPLLIQYPHDDLPLTATHQWDRYKDFAYIAMMAPPVALDLADWLDATAAILEERQATAIGLVSNPYAYRLADRILGNGVTDDSDL